MLFRKQQTFIFAEDRFPIQLFVSLFAMDIMVFLFEPSLTFASIYAFTSFFPKSIITAWNHHHQHVKTFKSPVMNMLLEIMYFFQTGVVPEGWVLHHNLGHHKNYLKGRQDESGWLNSRGKKMNAAEYTVKVGCLTYFYILRNALRHKRRHMIRLCIGLTIVFGSIYCLCKINPLNTVIIFLLPAIASLFATVWHTHKHHAGLSTQDHKHASFNILDPLYNKLTGNLGYHAAHHISAGTHWSKLPKLHERISSDIPANLYKEPGFPFEQIKYAKKMFNNIFLLQKN